MNEDYDLLVELISSEFEHYKDLRNLLRKEFRALVENNLDEINRIIPLKEELILKIQDIKEKREGEVERLFENKFDNFLDIIRELKSKVNTIVGWEIENLYNSVLSVISEIVLLNTRNNLLLKQSLSLTRNLIRKINSSQDTTIYDRKGSEKEGIKESKIVNKQV